MKKIIKVAIGLFLISSGSNIKAQGTVSVCHDFPAVIQAVNSSNLSNPSYSLNPGGVISANGQFTVSSTTAALYTLYVTGTDINSAVVTTSSTVQTILAAPVYTVVSPTAFMLGCGVNSVCTLNIINASTQPIPGGAVSYTVIPPGGSNILPSTSLSAVSSPTLNAPGSWTVVVKDNTSGCTTWSTITVSLNNTPPVMGSVSISQNPLTCANPTLLLSTTPLPNLAYNWSFAGTQVVGGYSLVVGATSVPSQTLVDNYTLTAISSINLCEASTVIPVYQNIFPPNAAITGLNSSCTPSLVLSNTSSSGIPPGVYPTNLNVVGHLWSGPVPQPTLGLSSTYTVYTSGTYSMVAMDMNNGCTAMATHSVALVLGTAAFVHTITSGQAVFNDASTGTGPNNYFWDFGDGTTSTLQNPTHTYSSSGAFLVKLKITNSLYFCSDSVIQSVNISGIPCAANSNFSMVPTGTAQVWNVIPAYPWNVTAASWNWGDGSVSNTLYTSHQYSAAGTYSICLSVTVSCGDTSTTCSSYMVYRGAEENLMLQVNVVAPALISGLASSTAMEQLSWEIFPNPNAGSFNLRIDNSNTETVHVTITDLSGRIVQDVDLSSGTNQIDSSNLSSGMYMVTLKSGNTKATKRMIVNH